MANKTTVVPRQHYGKIISVEKIPTGPLKGNYNLYYLCGKTKCEDVLVIFRKTHSYKPGQFVRLLPSGKDGQWLKPGRLLSTKEIKDFNLELSNVASDYDELFD
jgi:hypothetical protein